MKSTGIFYRLAAALIVGVGCSQSASAVCFVNHNANGANNGTSWADAYTNPQFALLNGACTEIWVARGVYKPTFGTDQAVSFEIGPGVAMYGGFAGGETSRDVRDPTKYLTVLSGDIDNNDANAGTSGVDASPADIVGKNSFHVVRFDGRATAPITSSTVLNGFTITGGDTSLLLGGGFGGGAICAGNGPGNECSPVLDLDIFSGNRASGPGGGLYANGDKGGNVSPSLLDVIFVGNEAGQGGGMYVYGATADSDIESNSAPNLLNVTFDRNVAHDSGGGMFSQAENNGTVTLHLEKVTFSRNSASSAGGGMNNTSNAGALVASLTNVTFFDNIAAIGGAIANSETGGDGDTVLHALSATFESNVADSGGAISTSGNSFADLKNVILWGDVSNLDHSQDEIAATGGVRVGVGVVSHDCPANPSVTCSGIFTGDPLLLPLTNNGGFTQTLLPAVGSSAIDHADDTYCPLDDQRLHSRPLGSHCDIGAVEVDPIPPPVAEPEEATTHREIPVTVTLKGSDSNTGGPFSYTYSAGIAKNGMVSLSGDEATYTPDHGFIGDDEFQYKATDVNGTSAFATVIIHVLAVPPVALPLSLSVPHNTSGMVMLMATDDNAGGPFAYTFAITQTTQHGSATLSGSTVTYVPTTDYTGPDSLLYTVTDVNGTSLPALVSIQVGAIPPVAQPRSITVPYNTAGVITFGATDSNSNGPFTFTFAAASSPSHGTLSSVSGSQITYTPTHNYSGPDTFTYTATDVNGTSIPATVTITVLPIGGGVPPGTAASVPTLSFWSLLALAGLLAAFAPLAAASGLKR